MIRHDLKECEIEAVISAKVDEARDLTFDWASYRERNAIKRLINPIKRWRRIATRYEKWATNSQAMLVLVALLLWL